MQQLREPTRLLWLALLLCDLAALSYMLFAGELISTPLELLPPLYWVFVLLLPVFCLIAVLVWGDVPVRLVKSGPTDHLLLLFLGGLFLLLALYLYLSQSKSGGSIVFYAAMGVGFMILSYPAYQRRALK